MVYKKAASTYDNNKQVSSLKICWKSLLHIQLATCIFVLFLKLLNLLKAYPTQDVNRQHKDYSPWSHACGMYIYSL